MKPIHANAAIILLTLLACSLLSTQAQTPSAFDYFANNWNVVGLKDYPRGARVTPENTVLLDESAGAVEIRFGKDLALLSRKQDKLAYEGWLPIILVNAEDGAIRYEFTIWATPMPDVKDWQKAFDWPTEGENFAVWIGYKVVNTSATPARAKLYIRKNPIGSAGAHYVDKLLKPGESLEQAARYPFFL